MIAAFLLVLVFLDTAVTGWLFAMQREQRRELTEQGRQQEMMRCWLAENDDIEF